MHIPVSTSRRISVRYAGHVGPLSYNILNPCYLSQLRPYHISSSTKSTCHFLHTTTSKFPATEATQRTSSALPHRSDASPRHRTSSRCQVLRCSAAPPHATESTCNSLTSLLLYVLLYMTLFHLHSSLRTQINHVLHRLYHLPRPRLGCRRYLTCEMAQTSWSCETVQCQGKREGCIWGWGGVW